MLSSARPEIEEQFYAFQFTLVTRSNILIEFVTD